MLPASVEVIDGLVAAAEAAPEELSVIANVTKAPPMPFIPAECTARPIVMALMVYAGGAEPGERAIAPIRALATPLADTVRLIRYPQMYEGPEGPRPGGLRGDERARRFPRAAVRRRRSSSTSRPQPPRWPGSSSACSAVRWRAFPRAATAFGHRGAKMMVNVAAMYESPDEGPEHEAWARSLVTALGDGSAAYVGFLADEGEEGVRRAYPPATLERLADVKRRYDPDNLFRLNLNVAPVGP